MQLFSNFASERESSPRGFLRLLKCLYPAKITVSRAALHKGKSPRPSLSQSNAHCDCLSVFQAHFSFLPFNSVFNPHLRSRLPRCLPPKKTSDWDLFPFQQVDVVFHFPLTLREPWRWSWWEGGGRGRSDGMQTRRRREPKLE